MAREDDLELSDEEQGESKGGSKKLIIIIAAIVVLSLAVGAGGYFAFGPDSGESTEVAGKTAGEEGDASGEEGDADEGAEPKDKREAIYVAIPDSILVQIQGKKKSRMLQVKVTLLVRSTDAEKAAKKHMPLIKNNLLMYFSSANSEELLTGDGKLKLRTGSLKVVQDLLKEQTGKKHVEQILFTGFVMQ